ncbi:MAG TPA: cytochrome c [Candidatus Saccharimonadia bacterium]|nr:cytochrome c [Candidatus Saccharimonadia bacterium]
MKRIAFALLALAGPLAAQAPDHAATIEYRQGIYKAIRWNWGPLAQMVQGKAPFVRADFVKRATRVSFLSHQLLEGYPAGSHDGAVNDALPAIWETFDDFSAKLDAFKLEARNLRVVAEAGDEAAIKQQFVKPAGTCKACHDKYRAD